jgi:hypothetical protein
LCYRQAVEKTAFCGNALPGLSREKVANGGMFAERGAEPLVEAGSMRVDESGLNPGPQHNLLRGLN